MAKTHPEPLASEMKQMLLDQPQPFALLEARDDGVSATLLVRGLDCASEDAFVQKAQCLLRALVHHVAEKQKTLQKEA